MNPVLILTHNNLSLTKKCVASVQNQDIPTQTLVIDNGSQDGTRDWLPTNEDQDADVIALRWQENRGVSAGWNWGLNYWFETRNADYVIVLNNDLIIGKSFCRDLLSYDVPFVTGTETTNLADLEVEWPRQPLHEHPQFSAFLIQRYAWEKIGPFQESMVNHASDCDYHVRSHRMGIHLLCANVPYYHERSSTLKNAPPKERREIELQADADREVFFEIYGCYPGTSEYAKLFE